MGPPISSIKLSKKALRDHWKREYPKDSAVRSLKSSQLCQILLNSSDFLKAKHIGIFAGLAWEIDLLALFKLHPRIYAFPKVAVPTRSMDFFEISSTQDLSPGAMGILEPTSKLRVSSWGEDDLILVPGLAFDTEGNRIGTGAGYYDRFFSQNPQAKRWGVCFHQQFHQQTLAHTHHDVRMGAIVTECGFFPAKKVESR